MMIKQLIQFPDLYYTKSHFPLEISQRAFDHYGECVKVMNYGAKKLNKIN